MTAHRHDFPVGFGHNGAPCRICAGEDDEALVATLAEELWNARPGRFEVPGEWENAGPYWHEAFRGYARASLRCMRRLPGSIVPVDSTARD